MIATMKMRCSVQPKPTTSVRSETRRVERGTRFVTQRHEGQTRFSIVILLLRFMPKVIVCSVIVSLLRLAICHTYGAMAFIIHS